MNQQALPTSLAPEVIIGEVHGDLQIKGWDRAEVAVKANPDDLTLEEQDDAISLSCRGSCAIRLPHGATVRAERVHGNVRVKLLEDQLSIDEVNGSLVLRSVGETQLGSVHGELTAKYVLGDLQADSVSGNLSLRDVQGDCIVDEIGGNLDLRDVEGNIQTSAKGNARIRLSIMSGDNYEINAGGNVNCRIPDTASVHLKLSSGAQVIKVRLPKETKDFQAEDCELKLGNGEVPVSISTGGMIFLTAEESDWTRSDRQDADFEEGLGGFSEDFDEQIAQQVEAQIEAQMEALNRQLSEQMATLSASITKAGLSEEKAEEILRQAQVSSERATARAQEKMRRAQEKLERKLEAARRRSELKAQAAERRAQARGKPSWNFEWGPPAPEPAKEPVSDEERLMILRMLEQKKISLEEAEELLAALEGKE